MSAGRWAHGPDFKKTDLSATPVWLTVAIEMLVEARG